MMGIRALGLQCLWLVTLVTGLQTCSSDFEESLANFLATAPVALSCMEQIGDDADDQKGCEIEACKQTVQTMYDMFPENCEVEAWNNMSQSSLQTMYKHMCNWDLH